MARNIAVMKQTPGGLLLFRDVFGTIDHAINFCRNRFIVREIAYGKTRKSHWEQLNVKVSDLEKAPLFIDDTPSLSIFDLRAKARRLSSQHGIKLIIVDYLQLMTAGSSNKTGNREQEISTISRNLKALAKELNVPVIALSQLSCC